ncbi:MAG: lysozyme [Candidatus Cloacimonetes bacterium HGW-Cloacimonetes-1]|jgi:lysozyme|nr:MAG: lysozyme [Candidatus Cloacimonetes bacterium HGW-Cloacimonetes-1]
MEQSLMQKVKEQLLRHEGLKLKPYRCPAGKLTIGVGRNLEECGISQKEAFVLMENDILHCESELLGHIPIAYSGLNETRKSVLLNMCFNLGISGLLEFKNTLAFIGAGDFERAANNMLASRWAKQVGRRAIELSEMMRKG